MRTILIISFLLISLTTLSQSGYEIYKTILSEKRHKGEKKVVVRDVTNNSELKSVRCEIDKNILFINLINFIIDTTWKTVIEKNKYLDSSENIAELVKVKKYRLSKRKNSTFSLVVIPEKDGIFFIKNIKKLGALKSFQKLFIPKIKREQ